jgi:hypothetical protein
MSNPQRQNSSLARMRGQRIKRLYFNLRNRATPREGGSSAWFGKLSAFLTIAGSLAAALWVIFQFAYGKWIEPRLSAAVIQTSTEATYISTSKCCYLYEITTKLENKGLRDVVIHASHQAVGARRLATHDDVSKSAVEALDHSFLVSRMPDRPPEYIEQGTVEYIFNRLELPFLFISVGNLVKPGVQLAPGEIHLNRSIAAVPLDHLVVSIRGSLLISHFKKDNLDWRWTVNKTTLEPLAMPWRRNDEESLTRLTQCALNANTAESKQKCIANMKSRVQTLYRQAWESDPYSYSQYYAADLIVKPSIKSEKD